MNIKDVLTLVNAGFSKEEIKAMLSDAPAQKQEAPAPKPEAPAPKPEKVTSEATPEQKDKQPQGNANIPALDLSGLNTAIDSLTKKIQNINLSAAELPEPETIQKKADDILASIINPPRAGK